MTNYFKNLPKEEWRFSVEDMAYVNKITGEKRYADLLHNEIECSKGSRAWVIDPVTGKVLDKKGHLPK